MVVASGAAFGIYRVASRETPPAFRFTTVTRGAIQALVSATGTLQAVTTVRVGTQVQGQIRRPGWHATCGVTSRKGRESP